LEVQGSLAVNALLGELGDDTLLGGGGRELLIGGRGADTLRGGGGDDLLIGCTTDFDADSQALCTLMAEWGRPDASYSARVSHLQGTGGGLNGTSVLTASTVFDDGITDNLFGEAGLDWFFARGSGRPKDRVTDPSKGEVVLWL